MFAIPKGIGATEWLAVTGCINLILSFIFFKKKKKSKVMGKSSLESGGITEKFPAGRSMTEVHLHHGEAETF